MASRGKYSAIVLDIDGTMVGPDRVIRNGSRLPPWRRNGRALWC